MTEEESHRNGGMWIYNPSNPKVCLHSQKWSEILKGYLCSVLESRFTQLHSNPQCDIVKLLWDWLCAWECAWLYESVRVCVCVDTRLWLW